MNETKAIFTIVLRNLSLPNWEKLEPEAQFQMIEEVAGLMKCTVLPHLNKRQLSTRLNVLESYVTETRRERIRQILDVCYQEEQVEVHSPNKAKVKS